MLKERHKEEWSARLVPLLLLAGTYMLLRQPWFVVGQSEGLNIFRMLGQIDAQISPVGINEIMSGAAEAAKELKKGLSFFGMTNTEALAALNVIRFVHVLYMLVYVAAKACMAVMAACIIAGYENRARLLYMGSYYLLILSTYLFLAVLGGGVKPTYWLFFALFGPAPCSIAWFVNSTRVRASMVAFRLLEFVKAKVRFYIEKASRGMEPTP